MLLNWFSYNLSAFMIFGFLENTSGVKYGREYWYEEAHITLQRRLSSSAESRSRYARNVVLFVGDGMGVATMTAARIFKGQRQGQPGEESNLEWDKFSALALAKTYNLDSQVGESSACATALLCGVKAYQETVGLDIGGRFDNCFSSFSSKVESLIDWAQKAGKSTGIVTNTRVTHATPAALYAHSASRYWEDDSKVPSTARKACKDIARQLVEDAPGKNIDVILGGGRRHWLPKISRDPELISEEGRRLDGRNLIDDWIRDKRKSGLRAEYIWNKEQMDALDPMKIDHLLGLFAYSHMDFEADRDTGPNGDPSLADMTKKALSIVQKNTKGFFLFVESGRIDHAHHYNNAYRALDETLVLESALLTVLSLVDLTETLIIVTSDHSNVMTFGGLATPRGNPILGPDTKPSDIDGFPYSTLLYGNGPGYSNPRAVPRNFSSVAEERNLVHGSAVPRQWATHGGEDVPVYAQGPLASIVFRGVVEQSYIPHAIAYIICIGQYAKRCNNNYTTTRPIQTCIVPEVSSIKTSSGRGRGGVVLASSVLSGSVRAASSTETNLVLIMFTLLSHYFFIT